MAVYVDAAINRGWRLGPNAHMIADTLDELHAMAAAIGLKRSWFQDKKSCPHYDLTVGRRASAVKHGAIELKRKPFVMKMREIRGSR